MPQTSISLSLRRALRASCVMIALVIFVSCSKKDHEPQPAECLFTGKTSILTSQTSTHESGNEVVLDDDKQLVSARSISNSEAFNQWKRTITTDHVPQYNSDGYLTRMIVTTIDLYEGTIGHSYKYNSQYYLKFKTETIETSAYQYESGRATTVDIKTVIRLQGDNDTPVVEESEMVKKYAYDTQNKLASTLITTPTSSVLSTFKNGVIASTITKNTDGKVIMDVQYDDNGKAKTQKSSNYLYEYTYDTRGNMLSVKFTQDGKPNYLQEFTYDDHVNPETHIPRIFKGIPESVETVRTSNGVNNMTSEKSTSYVGGPTYDQKFIYAYRADGLPESWAPLPDGSGYTMNTTFRYKCQ